MRAPGPLHREVGLPLEDEACSAKECIIKVVCTENMAPLDREEKKLA